MVVSMSAARVRQHFEANERDFGVANPLRHPKPAEQPTLPVPEEDP